jgi:hypothetical protein
VSSAGVSAASPWSSGGGLTTFANSFEISPIVFVNGIAGGSSGAKLPISQILQSNNWLGGLFSGGSGVEDFFAHFYPFNGSLAKNEIAHWPMANLVVAANDVIAQPLTFSLLMVAPANPDAGVTYDGKQAVMTALQKSVAQHISLGGWFDVATPSFLYQGCLLTDLREVGGSTTDGGQAQVEWVWEFEQPLISVQAAQGAQNAAMAKITANVTTSGNPVTTPALTSVGAPGSGVTQSLLPGAAALTAAQAPAPSSTLTSVVGVTLPSLNSVSPIPPGT